MENSKVKIKQFLSRFFKNNDLGDDDDFFELGYVNSLFAMQLILFIEKEFNITVNPQELDLQNFKTVNLIVSFIEEKQKVEQS